nr:MAG TPA: hypothetical protein [Caudoviricetes sp.]
MERLTFEGNFCDIAQCVCMKCLYDNDCSQKQVWERLKAYEDTGLTPKEVTALGELFDYALKESKTLTEQLTLLKHIRELAEADKDGRVTILPCRGDADIVLMRNGVAFKPDHWNIHLTTFAENQPTPSGKKVALFDLREVRESMEDKG